MTRNTIGNIMASLGLLTTLFGVGAFTHYDQYALGLTLFAVGAALMFFAPSTLTIRPD